MRKLIDNMKSLGIFAFIGFLASVANIGPIAYLFYDHRTGAAVVALAFELCCLGQIVRWFKKLL